MNIGLKIKKGQDLSLKGELNSNPVIVEKLSPTVAIIPDDFTGLVPKPLIHEGDSVKIGDPICADKWHPEIMLVSPVSGTLKAINRGERRKILEFVVENDGKNIGREFNVTEALTSADKARKLMQLSGLWAMTRQRPYDIVTEPNANIRDVFVTGFDSAPLAWNRTEFNAAIVEYLTKGVALLKLISTGKVYVTRREAQKMPDIAGAEMVTIAGPHPAGNASTAIANIKPINKGETVMTLNIDTLLRLGQLLCTGILPGDTYVAVTGSEIAAPKIVKTQIGAQIDVILKDELQTAQHHRRIISGNVLTGTAVTNNGYLRYPYTQLTIIPEGDDVDEFMGWASLSPKKMSSSLSFPAKLFGLKNFNPDARLLGGKRAMIMSGQYDRMMPLDILPEYLIKAIIGRDIDRMEQLGIYEVAPEDFALAEYADTSKLELQKIVREGLDYLRKELS